ncbi:MULTISPECIES: mechanosensitive ion channel family protein [Inquilinus]|uniref:Small-conductance mechanosensitive channel n=1 Tax=Inquilinus ginsengisoli TaxID=363840 RepID=A0ABU1JM79_9PROT|nr:mechanosensitive ion channel family protein [Inquilinus ginsengisoli]MDR6289452.1 small-conductance mechanosensitive channel [Inquilinus ginsengisoli]
MTSQIVASLLVVLCFLDWRLMRNRPVWSRLATCGILFGGLTIMVVRVVGSLLQPAFAGSTFEEVIWQQVLAAMWWLFAARLLVNTVRAALPHGAFRHEGGLLSDLLAGVIYLAATLTVVSTVFGFPVRALVATSGVIAIVLGLALQNTLADVFAGIAIGIERPYSVGDRVWIEGGIEGVVVQITWRSVRVWTDGNDIASVPNSIATRSRVINRSVPSEQRNDSVHVPCSIDVPPERVVELVRQAILLCPTILATPAAGVSLASVGKRWNVYSISFSVSHSSVLGETKSTLLTQVMRQFRAAGLGDARGGRGAIGDGGGGKQPLAIPLFQALTDDQRAELERQASMRTLDPGDLLFAQGGTEASLFVVVSGVLEVSRANGGSTTTIGRIGSGDYIGEIGLLTGAPHAGTVKALTHALVLEVTKEHLAPLLAAQPELMRELEASARHGQALVDRSVAASVGAHAVPPGQLLSWIRQYFREHGL